MDAGALGFSKERSLRYWPRTFIEGCACGPAMGPPGTAVPPTAVLDPFDSGVALILLSWAISIRLSRVPVAPSSRAARWLTRLTGDRKRRTRNHHLNHQFGV